MKMMKRLLNNLNRSWNKIPMEKGVMVISQGTGTHTKLTITTNQIHFHSMPFRPSLPTKQSIVLEDMTLKELETTIKSMGYTVVYTADGSGMQSDSVYNLLPVTDLTVTSGGGTIEVFTSKLWKMLYPIVRLLEEADGDTDEAIRQMFVNTSRGKWLDYWASFFKIKRSMGEDDRTLARRIFMTIMNLKTNNVAIEELLEFTFPTEVHVTDMAPALFEVKIDPDYLQQKELTDSIIKSVKGAGIDFFYHYYKVWEENYPSYIQDKTGKTADSQDELSVELGGLTEGQFGWKTRATLGMSDAFDLNEDLLNGDSKFDLIYTLKDESDMSGLLDVSETMTKPSEEFMGNDNEFSTSETVPKPVETPTLAVLDGFFETQFGYVPSGFELNVDELNDDALFGSYKLKDDLTSEVSSEEMERYDKMQEELLPLLSECSFLEVFKSIVESNSMEVTSNLAEDGYRFSNTAFEIGSSLLNGSVLMGEARTKEGGSMELRDSSNAVVKSATF